MSMDNLLLIITIAIGIAIVVLTLFQGKGGGLGSAWGNVGAAYQTKRGLEKVMLQATAILVFLFFVISVVNLLI